MGLREKMSRRLYGLDTSTFPPIIIMSYPFGIVFGYSGGKLGRHPQVKLITGLFLLLVMERPRGDTS
jgi:hypothetical protein